MVKVLKILPLVFVWLSFVSNAQIKQSIATGFFNDPSTWDCTCIPATNDSIVISNGDTVTLVAAITLTDVTVNAGGVFDNQSNNLNITRDYVINGLHQGSGRIIMSGTRNTVDGTGEVAITNQWRFQNGTDTILATANIQRTTGGQIRVQNNDSVINYGTIVSERNFVGGGSNAVWFNETGSSISTQRAMFNNGRLVASAVNNTVIYADPAGNQTIKIPVASTYHHLQTTASSNKNLNANLIVDGDLTLNGGNFNTNNFDVELRGNFNNPGGVFSEGTGELILNGTSDQYITPGSSEQFYDLTINKSTGDVLLSGDLTVSNTLQFTSGNIITQSNDFVLGTSASTPGSISRTSGHVIGAFERWINSTGVSILFPVGTSTDYRALDFTFNTLNSGSMTVTVDESVPGDAGLPEFDATDSVHSVFIEGFWNVQTSNGLTSTDFDLDAYANGFTSYTINSSTRLLSRSDELSNWVFSGSHVAAVSPVISRSSLTTLPIQIGIGDTTRCTTTAPVTSAITGSDSVCVNATGSAYSVTLNAGNTYLWAITGGTQVSGTNTNSITVDWGSDGMVGEVKVTEQNGCSFGVPQTLSVTVHSVPVSSISGPDNLEENSTSQVYSVTQSPGYTYNWTITGGSQVGGGTSNSITVDWGSAGSAQVQIEAISACGTSSATTLDVNLFAIIRSVTDGQFDDPTTWDCNCTPGITSNVVISSGDSVYLTSNQNVNDMTIEANGVLDGLGRQPSVYGDLTHNGRIRGTNRLNIRGSTSSVYGTGDFSNHSGQIRFFAGLHEISSEVNIDHSGNIRIQGSGTLENNGFIREAGNIIGANATTSVFTNKANATLYVSGVILANGILNASETGNTIGYEITGTGNQNVKQASNNEYYNLIIDGNNVNSDKLLASDIIILNDLTLSSSTFDVSTSLYSIEIRGNWNNTGGTFNPRTGSVTFNGSGTQIVNHSTLEQFNDVSINSGSSVLLRTAVDLNDDLVINSGATLDVNDTNNYQMTIAGDITSNGTFHTRDGNIELNGTSAQNINTNGSLAFYDLTMNNGNGATMQSGLYSLEGTLFLTIGTLTTNNSFTFLSSASGTARIDEITGSGDISGNILMQRYIPNGDAGWRFFGSAVSGATLSDWDDDIVTTGFTGADYPTFSFTSIYTYDETDTGAYTNGYTIPSNITDAINVGEGYWVYCSHPTGLSSGFVVDLPGPANTGTTAIPVSFTSSGGASQDGWNMVSNPFPSTIDWDDGSWTKTNMNSAIQIWDNVNQQYASYVTGVGGTNGGTNLISSSQGFWVQANASSPSLVAPESVKSTSDQTYLRNSAPGDQIYFQVSAQSGLKDETLLNFHNSSSLNFDEAYDAQKLYSSSLHVPSIAFELDSTDLSIQSIPTVESDTSMRLKVLVRQSGIYELKILPSINNESLSCLRIQDNFTSNVYDIETDTTISIYLYDTTQGARFTVYLGADPITSINEVSCRDDMDGSIFVQGQGNGPWNYTWLDSVGGTLKNTTALNSEDSLSNLSPGTYIVQVENSGVCGNVLDTITLKNPVSLESMFDVVNGFTHPVNENIEFNNLSTNAQSSLWDFGDGSTSTETHPVHTYQEAGEFIVSLTVTNQNCQKLIEKTITIDDVVPGIENNSLLPEMIVYQSGDYLNFEVNLDTDENVVVTLGNMLGQTLYQKDYQGGYLKQRIFVGEMNPGVLIISLNSGDTHISKKVAIQ